jgi:nodulation protein A
VSSVRRTPAALRMLNGRPYMPLHWSLVSQAQMSARLETEVRELLVEAFPQHADFFRTASYRGSVPEYRLLGRVDSGALCAHVGCGRRVARVADHPVRILGIGAVAVRPALQGQGLGREMFAALHAAAIGGELADFGFLECREAVAGFYERAGFERVAQPCTSMHHETQAWETYEGPVMVMPLLRSMAHWPRCGAVHLQGMSW